MYSLAICTPRDAEHIIKVTRVRPMQLKRRERRRNDADLAPARIYTLLLILLVDSVIHTRHSPDLHVILVGDSEKLAIRAELCVAQRSLEVDMR